MKEKLIVKKTGKPIKIGDFLESHYHQVCGCIEIIGKQRVLVNEQTIPELIKRRLITVQTFGESSIYDDVPKNLHYYYTKFLNTLPSINPIKGEIGTMFHMLINTHPCIVFGILLKQIAIELDSRYDGDISKCKKVFCISTTDGKVHELNRGSIKTFKNFAAFRTKEDALFAKKILGSLYKKCFSNGK